MKAALRSIALVLLLVSIPVPVVPTRTEAAAPPILTTDQASQHVGKLATVCGFVASARYAAKSRGRPTFLNLDEPYPHHIFTVLIWGNERPAFGSPELTFRGKRICATGRIELYKGKLEIIARKPSQIRVQEKK